MINLFKATNIRDYPVDVFPEKVQFIINSFTRSLNWPPEYTGSALLFAMSVAAGNRFSVRVKYGWVEFPSLYIFVIGHPGGSKTHAIKWPIKPINARDKDHHRVYRDLLDKHEQASKMSPAMRKETGMDEFAKPPRLKKHLVKDTTLEGLIRVLSENKDGVGAIFDEATSWFKNLNRYNSGSDVGAWLSMWNQDDIVKDRAGSESIRVDHPFVSVIGGIQPGILNDLSDQQMEENGMIDRILFAWPRNDLMQPIPREDVSMEEQERIWQRVIWSVLDYHHHHHLTDGFDCYQFGMSKQARDVYFDWDEMNVRQANTTGEISSYGVNSKMRSQVIRIALLIELMKHGCLGEDNKPYGPPSSESYTHQIISLETMQSAIRLCEYYKHTASMVRNQLHNPNSLDEKPDNVKEFYKILPDTFSTKDAVEFGVEYKLSRRSVYRILCDKTLFEKTSHGTYSKIN